MQHLLGATLFCLPTGVITSLSPNFLNLYLYREIWFTNYSCRSHLTTRTNSPQTLDYILQKVFGVDISGRCWWMGGRGSLREILRLARPLCLSDSSWLCGTKSLKMLLTPPLSRRRILLVFWGHRILINAHHSEATGILIFKLPVFPDQLHQCSMNILLNSQVDNIGVHMWAISTSFTLFTLSAGNSCSIGRL